MNRTPLADSIIKAVSERLTNGQEDAVGYADGAMFTGHWGLGCGDDMGDGYGFGQIYGAGNIVGQGSSPAHSDYLKVDI